MDQITYRSNPTWPYITYLASPTQPLAGIVKIHLRTLSFCLCQYLRNGLSYSGKETWLMLCINDSKLRSRVKDLERNKHQLLHRIASLTTPLIYNISNWNVNKNFKPVNQILIFKIILETSEMLSLNLKWHGAQIKYKL